MVASTTVDHSASRSSVQRRRKANSAMPAALAPSTEGSRAAHSTGPATPIAAAPIQ